MSLPGADCLIVIPCLNEEAFIGGLLDQLLADDKSAGALIVVADGGSADATRRIVSERAAASPRVRLLENPRRIQSAAVNLAVVRHGAGRRWLVRIDAHAGYPDGYVSSLLAVAAGAGADSVVVPMVTRDRGGCFQAAVAAAQNSALGTGGSAHRHAGTSLWVDHGHHALFDIGAFAAAGGYDESFSHNEDAELDARLTRGGRRIWLAGDVPIVYFPRAAPGPLFRQYFRYGQGRAKTRARHKAPLKVRQMLPLAVAPACLLAGLGVVLCLAQPALRPLGVLLALPAAAWAGGALLLGALVGLKAERPCALMAGAAAMVMHLAWSAGYLRQALFGPRPGPEPAPLAVGPV